MTPTESLAAAQLALYILLIIPVLFVLQQHGKHGLLAWCFLTAFCIIRITGAGLEISNPTGETAQIINGVGLSPLVLAFTGVLHEVNAYIKGRKPFYTTVPFHLAMHLAVMTAIALVIVGTTSTSSSGPTLRKVGYIVFLGILIAIVGLTALAWTHNRNYAAKKLLIGTTIALPFLAIRILYSVISAFDSSINAFTGPIAYRVVLSVLMELIVVIILVVFGILTRDIESDYQAPNVEEGHSLNSETNLRK